MKKVLIPVDGSERSVRSLEKVRKEFTPEEAQITLLTVIDTPIHYKYEEQYQRDLHKHQEQLERYKEMMSEYQVSASVVSGKPGPAIVRFAEQNEFQCLVMTRSQYGTMESGSVTAYIAKKAPFLEMMILQEEG